MKKQTYTPGRLEEERQELVRRTRRRVSDATLDAIELAHRMAERKRKNRPQMIVETHYNGSGGF